MLIEKYNTVIKFTMDEIEEIVEECLLKDVIFEYNNYVLSKADGPNLLLSYKLKDRIIPIAYYPFTTDGFITALKAMP